MENKSYDALLQFMKEDDVDFYEKYLVNLTEEELDRFLEANPDFLEDYVGK